MAKRKSTSKKTRLHNKLQRDPDVKAIAIWLKQHGFISKQANLRRPYVSYGVLKKVADLQPVYHAGYKAVKVPKKTLQKAKAEGFLTVGSRVVVPPDRAFIKRLEAGMVTGVKPVKLGFLEAVVLPIDIYDMRSLVHRMQLDGGTGLDHLKLKNEQFAFKYYGHISYRPFRDTFDLYKYLLQYRSIFDAAGDLRMENLAEEFENFQLLRLNPVDKDKFFMSVAERQKILRNKRRGNRRGAKRQSSWYRSLDRMGPTKGQRFLEKRKQRAADWRASLSPQELEEYKAKARARAKAAYERRKKEDQSK